MKITPDECAKLGGLVVRGHADLGGGTLLFRQPIAGLQIKDYSSDEWKWVKPQDATLIVNIRDALNLLTADYFKSTIHRVAVPPKDQQHVDRREGFTQNSSKRLATPSQPWRV